MTNKPNSRGSEWRKWDLHLHSFYTNGNNNFGQDKQAYIDKITSNNIAVVGLTNYFNFSDNDYNLKDELTKKGIVVFLNLELRLAYQNKEDECVDFHIIFSNTLTKLQINTFVGSINAKIGAETKRLNTIHTQDDKSKAVVEFDAIEKMIKNDDAFRELRNSVLMGFLSRGKGNGRSATTYEHLSDKCHFLIHSSDKVKNLEEDREYWLNQSKPLLNSSDAHKIADIGLKFTWIKADPTFEGLKQIIYEPEDRVRIQASNPLFDNEKPYFDSIVLCEDVKVYDDSKSTLHIKKATFNLNPNLVAIIGGRGTGKSTLINYLGHSFDKKKEREIKMLSNQCFSTKYCKVINPSEEDIDTFTALNSNSLDFVFIKQGGFKEQVRKGELSSELKRVANLESIAFSDILTSEINKINREIQDCTDYRGKKNESSEEINTQVYCDKIIKTNQTLLSNITNSKNKEDIEHYNKNLKEISKLQNLIKKAEIIEEKIKDFVSDIESTISQLDEDGKKLFSIPVLTEYNKSVKTTKEDCKNRIHTFEATNQAIEDSLKEKGISGDFTTLLNNVSKYQKIISDGEIKKKEIQAMEEKFKKLKDSRSLLGNRIVEDCKRQKNEINDGWSGFLSKHSDERKKIIEDILLKNNGKGNKIEVYGDIIFDSVIFWKLLKEANHGSILEEKLKEEFRSIQDADSWATYIAEKFNDKIDSLKIKKNEFLNLFFDKNTRQQYLRTEAKMRYDGKELSKLSDGQKGTAYLRLQLANSAFSEPIIFDQPEDDLDNEFIVEELVDIFKRLKKYRQIIIVTHNANLVVNADAEQVIVAQNDNEYLSYRCGSLEDADIQNAVCRILEGGKHAFEKRRKKYNFDKLKNAN